MSRLVSQNVRNERAQHYSVVMDALEFVTNHRSYAIDLLRTMLEDIEAADAAHFSTLRKLMAEQRKADNNE